MYYRNYFHRFFGSTYLYNTACALLQSRSVQPTDLHSSKLNQKNNFILKSYLFFFFKYVLSGKDPFVVLSAFLKPMLCLSLSACHAGNGDHVIFQWSCEILPPTIATNVVAGHLLPRKMVVHYLFLYKCMTLLSI